MPQNRRRERINSSSRSASIGDEGYALMTRRLATMCFITMLMTGASPLASIAQQDFHTETLKGITTVAAAVETNSDGAKALGLTTESIQTDIELKLRMAGMHVVTMEELSKLPGMPCVCVQIAITPQASAAHVFVRLEQNSLLQRNGQLALGVTTWDVGTLLYNPNAQAIRDNVKDNIDKFLNAWLSVNPKK
jgi:hypothetical protein